MSTTFHKVVMLECSKEATFCLSDDIYEELLGDERMPISINGTWPTVVCVEYGRLAEVLMAAGIVTKEEIESWPGYNVWHAAVIMHQGASVVSEAAIQELANDQDMAAKLKENLMQATKDGDTMILYRVA